ncbi:hypothetical protein MtrunA17_Chr3g0085821 [Medicago truncatula]|uniref:Uncharacterized protein n=1 Tax=Medicago truncatula TaxID=3880 RepID=A0A396IMJ3_MEDTR|nr:hypothetical protein MtrunA17_Chr3g0085821 [Medicago truncatula]
MCGLRGSGLKFVFGDLRCYLCDVDYVKKNVCVLVLVVIAGQEKKRSGVKIVVCVLTVEYFFHVGPPSFLGCLRVDFTELEMSKNLLLGEEILQPVLSCVFGYYRTKF